MTCEKCGAELIVGEWPFCPHGVGMSNVIGDECDIVQENGFRHPRHFTHKSELKRALAEKGLEEHACNAGPHDKLVPRWVSVDLEAARILVTRPSETTTRVGEPLDVPVTWTVTEREA